MWEQGPFLETREGPKDNDPAEGVVHETPSLDSSQPGHEGSLWELPFCVRDPGAIAVSQLNSTQTTWPYLGIMRANGKGKPKTSFSNLFCYVT